MKRKIEIEIDGDKVAYCFKKTGYERTYMASGKRTMSAMTTLEKEINKASIRYLKARSEYITNAGRCIEKIKIACESPTSATLDYVSDVVNEWLLHKERVIVARIEFLKCAQSLMQDSIQDFTLPPQNS